MPREVKCSTWKGEPFRYAHAKRDGIWLELIKDAQGVVSCWTRQPRDVTEKLMWHPVYSEFAAKAPPSTVLYCELFVEGAGRDAVKGAMRDRLPTLRIECFAVEKFRGCGEPGGSGSAAPLESCEEISKSCGVSFTPFIEYDDMRRRLAGSQPAQLVNKTLMLAIALPDTEGWMLKDGNLLNWRKLKAVETYDLRVVGFTAGRGKYVGQVGALLLADSTGNVVAKCGGMTDYQRLSMTERWENWNGAIIEVACQGRGSAGGLAHPRFIRVREDKTEADTLE